MTAMMTDRKMTKGEARTATQVLLYDHGLTGYGWIVVFDNARRRAGQCDYRRMQISLSLPLMARRSYDETMNTIVHEVAHALTPGHNHDATWARKHRELGGDGKRCFEVEELDPTAPWLATCGHGKEVAVRYRTPRSLHGWSCKCSEPGDRRVTWTKR